MNIIKPIISSKTVGIVIAIIAGVLAGAVADKIQTVPKTVAVALGVCIVAVAVCSIFLVNNEDIDELDQSN